MPEQNHIVAALTFELSKVETKAVRGRVLGQLVNIDPDLAKRVASGLGWQEAIEPIAPKVKTRTDLKPSPALSILAKAKPTLEGRQVGILVADGTEPSLVAGLKAAIEGAGGMAKVVAPKVGGAKGSDGKQMEADFQLAGGPSVLFDAVVIAVSAQGAKELLSEAAAVAFVHDAFQHVKVIGHTRDAQPLLDKAGVMPDAGVVAVDGNGGENRSSRPRARAASGIASPRSARSTRRPLAAPDDFG